MQAQNALWNQVTGGGLPDSTAETGLVIRFELRPELNQAKSDAEARPVYDEVEYIEIRSPNDPLTIIERPVEAKDKALYPRAYKSFKEGTADAISGTPLKEWPPISKSLTEQLAFKGIRSVEQFAEISDDACQHLGHGFLTLRNKAIAWLEKAKDGSQVTKMAAELAKRDLEISSLQRQLSELISRLGKDEDAPAPKKQKHT